MAVRKIKSSWWVDFRADHTRYRIRSPENSRTGAVAYEAMLKHKLARGEQIGRSATMGDQNQTFERFAWRWFEEYVTPNNKFSEARTKKYILKSSLIPFFGRMPVKDIKVYHIEQFKARRVKDGLANKSIKNHLSVFNKCLTCAYEWLVIAAKPPKILWPKCPPPETDYLSPDECELIVSHAKGIVHEMILMALRTGMRQGELKGLQWSSIDWENRVVIIKHSQCDREKTIGAPKNNRIRSIPLDPDLYEILYRRRGSTGYVFTNAKRKALTQDWLTYHLDKACKEAGLRRITWHVLRHTFASHLAMRGVPLNTVQTLLGHSTIVMTMRYAHVAPSTLRSAIALLNTKSQFAGADFGQPVGNQWQEAQKHFEISKEASLKSA
jgi:integrase